MTQLRKKVLLVEDDKDYLWILRQSLAPEDLDIVYALDGEEGLAKAEAEKPDLILIDIQMPKMDGITMAKKIREKKIESKIIFLTNLSDAEHISEAFGSGEEADYIVKSDLKVDDIIKRVKTKLEM